MNKFYVYIYLDSRKPGNFIYDDLKFDYLPFYVGKGSGNRLFNHLKENKNRNPHKNRIIKSIEKLGLNPIILKISENLEEKESHLLEIEIIKKIGRFNLKNGPLTNLTDGGEGSSGYIQSEETKNKRKLTLFSENTKWRASVTSPEFRKLMSKKTHCRDEEYRKYLSKINSGEGNPMYGKKGSEKQKEAVRKAHREGRIKISEKGMQNIIESNKKRIGIPRLKIRTDVIEYILISPLNIEYLIFGAKKLQNFCCIEKIQYHTLKNNQDIIITEDIILGKKRIAKNTIGWKLIKKIN